MVESSTAMLDGVGAERVDEVETSNKRRISIEFYILR